MPTRPPLHAPPWAATVRQATARAREQRRGSREERGYDWAWRKFRIGYLSAHPLCMDCAEQGITRPATEPHHILKVSDRPDLRLDERNLLALCHDCHATRTGKGE
jgi:5-methylcytosine-specific restriction protein A